MTAGRTNHTKFAAPSKEEPVTVFACGPNRSCEHVMDRYEPIRDEMGFECGMTLVCSKCGETAFNISLWEDL